MKWQLEVVVEGEKYQDLVFPLEQFAGANINLVNALTVVHPLNTEKDAASYVPRLGQVATRMEEATAEARDLASKGMMPPRFIVRATLAQMQQFIGVPAAQNPYVTAFADRMAASGAIPESKLEELRAAAERVTASQIYPAWQKAIARSSRSSPSRTMTRVYGDSRTETPSTRITCDVSRRRTFRRTRYIRLACARWRGSRPRWTRSSASSVERMVR